MNRALLNMAGGCTAALLLLGSTALSANASYLGYGNGDPGNWDLWTEQAGGPPPAPRVHTRHFHHANARIHHAQRHAHVHHRHRTGEQHKHI
jgi:hypothetical protein